MSKDPKETMSQDLLDILVCPSCHATVKLVDEDSALLCEDCGLKYPVRDGIPVMLVDEAEQTRPETAEQ